MFCMSVFGLFTESLTRLRIRHESEHQRAPWRFPARSTPHPLHRPFTRSIPSRHSCEQYVSGISRRVQRTSASTLPHLSHASLAQTPYLAKSLACCSAVNLMAARSPQTARDFVPQHAKGAFLCANAPAESDVKAGLPEGLKAGKPLLFS